MDERPRMITVLIEYSPSQNRVMVRGAWYEGEFRPLPPLETGNIQNAVTVFANVDMKFNVGFTFENGASRE